MGLLTWMRDLDERVGLRPTDGPFDCGWCLQQQHAACTGVAIRPRLPLFFGLGFGRFTAQTLPCACHLRIHGAKPSARER